MSSYAQAISVDIFNDFFTLTSYNGTIQKQNQIFLQVSHSGETSTFGWSLRITPNGPITDGTKSFPPERIKYQVYSVVGSSPNFDGVTASISSLNLLTGQIPLSTDAYLVQNSPYNLKIQYNFNIRIYYNMIIDGGAYLKEYVSNTNYNVPLRLELINSNGAIIDTKNFNFGMRLAPSDSPPASPTYGIQFDANAKNVLLEFKTAGDYANGVSKTLTKAFSTFSNTPYVVRVNTLNSNLTSSGNHTLPVNAVKLSVKDNQSGAVTGNVNLSGSQQNILTSSAHTATKFFDTTYSTQAGDNTFFNKSYEQYSGTVVFTMIPQ